MGAADSTTFNMSGLPASGSTTSPYDEKDEPQPQERVEFGLMKLNP